MLHISALCGQGQPGERGQGLVRVCNHEMWPVARKSVEVTEPAIDKNVVHVAGM